MPRKPRIEIAGYYHVINRGVEQRVIFKEAEDYEYFEELLCTYAPSYGVTIHNYCLMRNIGDVSWISTFWIHYWWHGTLFSFTFLYSIVLLSSLGRVKNKSLLFQKSIYFVKNLLCKSIKLFCIIEGGLTVRKKSHISWVSWLYI